MPRVRPDLSHARIYSAWLELPAWRTLTPNARALLTELLATYRPHISNRFELSERRVAKLLNCGRTAAVRAVDELEDRGWIEGVHVGRMNGPKSKRASAYALTEYPRLFGESASKAYLHWRPAPRQRLDSKPATARIRAVNGSLQSQNNTSGQIAPCAINR